MDDVAQILTKAKALIPTPDTWAKNEQAFTVDGKPTNHDDPEACRWCAAAAIAVVAPNVRMRWAAYDALAAALKFKEPRRIVAWNNAKRRKHSEVLAAFDRAIEAAK